MRLAIAGLMSLAVCGGAFAQELSWTSIAAQPGMAAAYALKPAADGSAIPQLQIMIRVAQPGAAPGEDVRSTTFLSLDLDCAAGKFRPVAELTYGADFQQTQAGTVSADWHYFAALGELTGVLSYACMTPNPPVLWKADVVGAQQKLDATLPKPKIPIVPPATSRFEFLGDGGASYRSVEHWLDTASITREGNIAKVWKVEIWKNNLLSETASYPPVTWRLYEIECAQMQRSRNVFWRQLSGGGLTSASDTERQSATFSTGGDPNTDAMMMRVCDNRQLLFSKTVEGDLKTLLAKKYGAGTKLGVAIPIDRSPAVQPVDLGPTIRTEHGDGNYVYKGVYTRQAPDSPIYTGTIQAEGLNPYGSRLIVKGIVEGKLVLERQDINEGEMTILLTGGKPSGNGIAYWERDNDKYWWKLIEPSTITLK